jgi:2OG-Fe(II) oxygenase superfamily
MNTLHTNNYVYIPNFISSHEASKLANEFRKHCNENNCMGDSQVANSQTDYNFIGFLELLCEKTPEVTKFTEEKVLPTYTYGRVYNKGAELLRHRDREACEVSLTVHLDGDKEWPIYIQKPNGEEVELTLHAGDAMLYLGMQADHWRNKYDGENYVQVFLHYVKSRGSQSWTVFDKQRTKNELVSTCTNGFNKSVMNETLVNFDEDFVSTPLQNFIITFDNIIDDELCDIILKEYMDCKWEKTLIGNGVVDDTKRNVDTIGISYDSSIALNPQIRKQIDQRIFDCAGKAIEKYNEMVPEALIEQDTGYELLRYKEGQFYIQHTDSFKARPRAVSCSFVLNDDYEGGEWGFFDNKIKIKPKKGSVVMFPSNFLYPHQINTVTKGTRYSIITWFI